MGFNEFNSTQNGIWSICLQIEIWRATESNSINGMSV